MANEKNDSTQQWFLRIAGGSVFGPVSTKGLVVWAEQGRIVPGNEVSNNRETWLPAETVPELEMTWYVNAGAKTEGPFNRIAAESFLKSGKAPAGAKLIAASEIDPAVLAHRNDPADAAEAPKPAPEPRQPAASRQPAAKPAEAKAEPDLRDRRIAELEAALEKQRETVTLARQAAKAQSALEDERDQLRKQMQDLQAQMENFRANAEKDAQKRERKLESLKQEMLRLQQEQEAARSRSMLELVPAEPAPDSAEDLRQAMEELRRQADDERRALERDAGLLRARIQQLEAELALASTAAVEARAAQPPSPDPALQQACEALRQERNEACAANDTLRTRATQLDQHVAELASQVGQLETECRKLADEREKLQHQLGIAMSAASDATNEAANGELRRRVEQLEAVNEGLRTQLSQTDKELTAEHASMAELLASSNDRDLSSQQRIETLEHRLADLTSQLKTLGTSSERETKLSAELATARSRIAELQGRLARLPESTSTRPPEALVWLRQFASDELTSLDKALHEERQSFNGFRELSTVRQEAIQGRIQAIQRLLAGDFPDARRAATPGQRISLLDQSRLQNEVDSMRESQLKETKQFEEREAELLRRIRLLETEESRLRSQLEATDMEGGKRLELMETVRRREQELSQERRYRDQDREQFQTAQCALLRRIEELERASGLPSEPKPAGERREDPAIAAKNRRLANFGGWLKR